MTRFSIMLAVALLATIAAKDSRLHAATIFETPQCGLASGAAYSMEDSAATETRSELREACNAPRHCGLIEWSAKSKSLLIGDFRWFVASEPACMAGELLLIPSLSPRSLQQFAVRLQI